MVPTLFCRRMDTNLERTNVWRSGIRWRELLALVLCGTSWTTCFRRDTVLYCSLMWCLGSSLLYETGVSQQSAVSLSINSSEFCRNYFRLGARSAVALFRVFCSHTQSGDVRMGRSNHPDLPSKYSTTRLRSRKWRRLDASARPWTAKLNLAIDPFSLLLDGESKPKCPSIGSLIEYQRVHFAGLYTACFGSDQYATRCGN